MCVLIIFFAQLTCGIYYLLYTPDRGNSRKQKKFTHVKVSAIVSSEANHHKGLTCSLALSLYMSQEVLG